MNCVNCNEPLSRWNRNCTSCGQRVFRGYQWRSEAEFMGWPLIHITAGRDRVTGKLLVAKGIIAIGQFATGLFTIAQFGIGLFTIAQFGIGLCFGMGQLILGFIAIAQVAVGIYLGIGQVATGMTAVGMVALGVYIYSLAGYGIHCWTKTIKDPQAVEYFTNIWSFLKSFLK